MFTDNDDRCSTTGAQGGVGRRTAMSGRMRARSRGHWNVGSVQIAASRPIHTRYAIKAGLSYKRGQLHIRDRAARSQSHSDLARWPTRQGSQFVSGAPPRKMARIWYE